MRFPNERTELRVLVVDRNPWCADSMAAFLRQCGHKSRIAGDGVTALRLAKDQAVDVVILDLSLATLDGFEVAARLREQAAGEEKLPLLIATTGAGDNDDLQRCRETGFDLYLNKPIETDYLQELLERFQSIILG